SNFTQCAQVVTVIDTTAPQITCATNKTVELGSVWVFNPPTATDLSSNAITVVSTTTNAGACGNGYVATRTWRATDACSNFTQCAQVVTVVDTTAPQITCATNKTIELGTIWTFDPPTSTDLSSNNIVVVSTLTNAGVCGN